MQKAETENERDEGCGKCGSNQELVGLKFKAQRMGSAYIEIVGAFGCQMQKEARGVCKPKIFFST